MTSPLNRTHPLQDTSSKHTSSKHKTANDLVHLACCSLLGVVSCPPLMTLSPSKDWTPHYHMLPDSPSCPMNWTPTKKELNSPPKNAEQAHLLGPLGFTHSLTPSHPTNSLQATKNKEQAHFSQLMTLSPSKDWIPHYHMLLDSPELWKTELVMQNRHTLQAVHSLIQH